MGQAERCNAVGWAMACMFSPALVRALVRASAAMHDVCMYSMHA